MTKSLPPLIPPFRFATVEDGLFRGSYPKERNLRFFKRLRLKTILSLIPDPPDPFFCAFCGKGSIQMVHLRVDKAKEGNISLSYALTIQALQIMVDPANLPLYIHCLDGADITGLIVSCLRRLQMWNISSSTVELLRNLKSPTLPSEHMEFVSGFTFPLELPVPHSIPQWLWGGEMQVGKRHPVLHVRWTNPEMLAMEEEEKRRREHERVELKKRENADLLNDLLTPRDVSSLKRPSKLINANPHSAFANLLGDVDDSVMPGLEGDDDDTGGYDDGYAGEEVVSMTLKALALEGWKR